MSLHKRCDGGDKLRKTCSECYECQCYDRFRDVELLGNYRTIFNKQVRSNCNENCVADEKQEVLCKALLRSALHLLLLTAGGEGLTDCQDHVDNEEARSFPLSGAMIPMEN